MLTLKNNEYNKTLLVIKEQLISIILPFYIKYNKTLLVIKEQLKSFLEKTAIQYNKTLLVIKEQQLFLF